MTIESNLGFKKNPFAKKSSEQEITFLDEIFYEPNYYATLMDLLSGGDSRFIIGQRGHGKSSIINKLYEDLEKKSILTIKIDRFDSIPINNNETALLKLIISNLVTKIAIFLDKNRLKIKSLDKSNKAKLTLFIRLFFKPLIKEDYERIYDSIQKVRIKNFLIRLFNNYGIGIANATASAAVIITSNTVRKSLGFPDLDASDYYKEYIKKIPEIGCEDFSCKNEDFTKEKLKQILDELILIVNLLGFSGTVILFDKIDEYQSLNQDLDKIKEFTSEILSDTELLLNNKIAIGFSLWTELKNELSGIVRFDKFGTIDVRWSPKDLEPLINKRLKYFSSGEVITLSTLLPNVNDKNDLIKVSNKSPRDLISAMAEIYKIQANQVIVEKYFHPECITNGLINFCKEYDYESMTPSKKGKNLEIKAMINRLLKVRLNRFTTSQLTKTFNQTSSQSVGQIKIMQQYKLVREDEILGNNGEHYYEVIDPKVEYLIKRGITQIE